MSYQSVPRRSLFRNTQPRPQKSAFTPPVPVNAPSRATHPDLVQREQADAAFQRHQFEADGLIVQEKLGVITPSQQERLAVLQAKMDDHRSDRLTQISKMGGVQLDPSSREKNTEADIFDIQRTVDRKEYSGSIKDPDASISEYSQGHIIQRYFNAPHLSETALVGRYIQQVKPEKLRIFQCYEQDQETPIDLYDFIEKELDMTMHDIYDWEDSLSNPNANQKIDDGFGVEDEEEKAPPPEAMDLVPSEQSKLAKELANLSMRDLLIKAFQESKLTKRVKKDSSLFNLLLDFGLEELKSMNLDDKVQKLPEYYRDQLMYTSCHRTAHKLLVRMSSSSGNLEDYIGKDQDAAKDQDNDQWLSTLCQQLYTSISNDIDQDGRVIYETHCGGHGFAIIIRNKQAEIVQSFANAVALVERMERGALILDKGEILSIIQGLASANKSERDHAANTIADCDAAMFGLMPYPRYQFRWQRKTLKSDEELFDFFKQELEKAFKAIKSMYKNW